MNVFILPWELDICIKRHEFQVLIVSSGLLNWKKWIKYAAQITASGRIFLSMGSMQHSSSPNMNSPRASRRFKEHSERDFTQRTHVKFRISLHSQELCNVSKKNQLFNRRSSQADRVIHCVTTSRLWKMFWAKSKMPHKRGSKNPWLKLRGNLENFELKLPRNSRVPRFSSCKIWRENNFTKDNSPLAPILSGLVASTLLILVPSNGTYNQKWAKHSNEAQEHRGRLRRWHEGGRYSEDGATYQEKSWAVQR